MNDIYKNIDGYNLGKKPKIIVFDDMIADMVSNKNLNPIVIELFIRGKKPCTLFYFETFEHTRASKKMAINHSPSIKFDEFSSRSFRISAIF